MAYLFRLFLALSVLLSASISFAEESPAPKKKLSEKIDEVVQPLADSAVELIFEPGIPVKFGGVDQKIPFILILLGGTAVFLTFYFKFINLRGFRIAYRTIRGKYTDPDAPGQITHFQALTAALSATVGLGNIGGVAVAISLGGPGATFWMIVLGFCGMTSKFAECTLGVKFRRIDSEGRAHGGAMYYLRDGLKDLKIGPIRFRLLGTILALAFALFVIGGAFGAGNMYQANQAFSQFSGTWVSPEEGSFLAEYFQQIFGGVMAVLVGLVIIGGIVWIARVTSFLVPFMCGIYVLTALIIILTNVGEVIPAFGLIIKSAFSAQAVSGGIVGVLIQGIQRATFSNEAGLGSAAIAHAAVKTNRPASEGMVALLGPFIDTVVVCTCTALVIVITGAWRVNGEVNADNINLVQEPGASEVVEPISKGQFVHIRNRKETGEGESAKKWIEVIGLVSSDNRSEKEIHGWVSGDAISENKGVQLTSMAFGTAFSWFPEVLSIAVLLFAFSTMISWSYYGEQGVIYLFGFLDAKQVRVPVLIYKIVFCGMIIVGASASLDNIINLSDSMVFAMAIPNLIGLYLLLPVIKKELSSYLAHAEKVDAKEK